MIINIPTSKYISRFKGVNKRLKTSFPGENTRVTNNVNSIKNKTGILFIRFVKYKRTAMRTDIYRSGLARESPNVVGLHTDWIKTVHSPSMLKT